jgi:hypothetical protein
VWSLERVARAGPAPTLWVEALDGTPRVALVLDDSVRGEPDPGVARALAGVARAAGCRLLGVHVLDTDGGPAVCGADLWPDLDEHAAIAVAERLAAA